MNGRLSIWERFLPNVFVALAISLACPLLRARDFPPTVPPPAAVNFHMPAVHRLPNGLRVFLVKSDKVPIVRLYAIVQAGAEADPPGLAGTASMVAGLLPEGTRHRSAYQIAEIIDQAGGSVNTGAGWDESYANVSVLSDHKAVAFRVLADLLIHPEFAAGEVKRIRKQTLSALDVVDQDPGYVADVVMRRYLFAGTRYAHSEDGTHRSIERITRGDLLTFHSRYYVPSRTILAVVGDISEAKCLSLATRFLGSWKNGHAAPPQSSPEPQPLRSRQVIVVNRPGSVQTEIRVASLGISRSNPDYFALKIANQVLGGPAANRLFDVLRTEHGLSYGASSYLDCYATLGAWVAKTSTRSSDTIRATRLVLNQIARLRKQPVQQWEIQNARDYLVGHEALQFESGSQVANQALEMMIYHLPADYWNRFPKKIRSLTASQVLAVTRKYLDPDDDVIVLVGDVNSFRSGLENLGTVHVIPIVELGRAFPQQQKGTADHPAPGR